MVHCLTDYFLELTGHFLVNKTQPSSLETFVMVNGACCSNTSSTSASLFLSSGEVILEKLVEEIKYFIINCKTIDILYMMCIQIIAQRDAWNILQEINFSYREYPLWLKLLIISSWPESFVICRYFTTVRTSNIICTLLGEMYANHFKPACA